MANINDIESLFSLIGQSPNDYKEFYHEKNGLHALDKWSYLKNIQLENPNDGLSIFENGPVSTASSNSESSMPSSPIARAPNIDALPSEKVAPFTPPDVVVSAPKVERYTSPVLDAKESINSAPDVFTPQTSTFDEQSVEVSEPEPLTPPIYNPATAPQTPPPAPKIYTTTAIPSVPTFSTNFNRPMNPTTATTFTSGFIKPTAPSNSNLQSTFTASRVEPIPNAKSTTEPEAKPTAQTASPLNSIFSRLEQK